MKKINKILNIALIFILIVVILLPDYAYSTNIAHLRVPIQPATYNRIEDTQKKIVRIQQLDQKAERDDKNKNYPQAIFKLLSDGKFRTRSEIAKILHSSERIIQPYLRSLINSGALLKFRKKVIYISPHSDRSTYLIYKIKSIIENNRALERFKSLLSAEELEDLGKRIKENFKDNKQDALSIAYHLIYRIKKAEKRETIKGSKITYTWFNREPVYNKKIDLVMDIIREVLPYGETHPDFQVVLKKDAKNIDVHIRPYIYIGNEHLIREHVIFFDKDVVNNPSGFKKALLKIKYSYDPASPSTQYPDFVSLGNGRIGFNPLVQVNKPVVLLKRYTEKEIREILGEVISKGIYFRDLKKSKLGYAELEKLMMPIYHLPDMECIVLTGLLDNIDRKIYTMFPLNEVYSYKRISARIVIDFYAWLYYYCANLENLDFREEMDSLTFRFSYLTRDEDKKPYHIKTALDEENKILWIFSEYYNIYMKFKINPGNYFELSSKDDFKNTGLKEEDILDTWYKYSKLLVLNEYLQLVRKHFADPYGTNKEEMIEALNKISKVALKHLFEIDLDGRLVSSKSSAELKKIFQTALPIESSSLDKVLARYEDQIMKNSVNLGDPRYVAHMTPYPLAIAIFVELLISAVNPNQIAFEASPGGTFAELEAIRWLSEIVGYDPVNAGGSIVAGGTTANETAFLVARNYRIHKLFEAKKDELYYLGYKELPDVTKIGLPKAIEILKQLYPRFSGNFVMLTSEAAHYSHKKLGGYVGIGSDNIIDLKTKNGKIDITLLKNAVKAHEEKGDIILAIISTAGTTEEGLYDDIQEIANIAKEKNIWFHVDSAYGGAVKMSQKYKDLARGMELADSITIDPHKWFYIPYSIGAILFKDKTSLEYIKQSAAYALREDEEDNLGSETLQGSKRFDALKLWFALQLIGVKDFGKIIDYTIDQTREIAEWLSKASDFEVIREPQINVLCSRFIPKETRLELSMAREKGDLGKIESLNGYINYLNKKIYYTLKAEGHWYFAKTTLKNSQYRLEGKYQESNNLEVLMNINMNPYIDQKILQKLYSHVAQIGYDLHKKYLTDASGLEYQILKEVRTNL